MMEVTACIVIAGLASLAYGVAFLQGYKRSLKDYERGWDEGWLARMAFDRRQAASKERSSGKV